LYFRVSRTNENYDLGLLQKEDLPISQMSPKIVLYFRVSRTNENYDLGLLQKEDLPISQMSPV